MLIAHRDRARADDARRQGDDRDRAAAAGADDRRGAGAAARSSGATDNIFKSYTRREGGRRRRVRRGDAIDRRGRVRDRRAGAALHRAERHARRRRSEARRHRVGLDAVPVLHPPRARRALRPAGGAHPRRPDGDRRRLRRQGGVPVGHRRPRGAARVEVGPAGEDDLRPHRGHGVDDQAPSVADAASHGGRRATDACSRWTSTSRSTAAPTARCRRSCCRAAPFTPPDRTRVRTCACAAAPSRPTCRRTAPSAASARRRASSRSSGTWTRSPPPSASRPRNSAAATSSGRATRSPSGRRSRSRSTCRRCSIARWRCRGYHEKRERFARENPGRAIKKGIGFASFMHGAGFTGSGEVHLASVVDGRRHARRHRPRAVGEHRDRPGHQHDLFADRRRRARHRLRRRRRRPARHRRWCPTADRPSRRAPAWSSASWSRPPRSASSTR